MLDIILVAILIIVMILVSILIILVLIGANMNKSDYERQLEDEEQIKYLREYATKNKNKWYIGACLKIQALILFERKRLVMNRKKYRITIKMVKEIVMDHEQISMQKAKEYVKEVIENSTKENLNKIFNSEPKFIYKVEIMN